MNEARLFVAGLSALAFAAACGSQQTEARPAESPATSGGAKAEEVGAPDVPWDEKSRKQKMEYMGVFVFPKMKEIFQAQDPEGYKDFKCQTCHGDDMDQVDFKMPNALYALPAEGTYEAALEYDEATTKFMGEKVLPAMSELLGKEPGKEFKCLSCHQTEEG